MHADIKSDRRQLRNLMNVLGFQKSTVRDTGAWMAEKLARTKLGFSNGKTVGLCLVESLEVLQLGFSGKRALWHVLSAVGKNSRVLQHTDFTALERRAVEQLERVEAKRLAAARATFRDA